VKQQQALQERAWMTRLILVADDKASDHPRFACYKSILTI
jgi:hypothetical protein